MIPEWDEIKKNGQQHYKQNNGYDIEPIDLYKSGGILHDGIIWNIIKNAYRCRREVHPKFEDAQHYMTEILHYANMLLSYLQEKELQRINTLQSSNAGQSGTDIQSVVTKKAD